MDIKELIPKDKGDNESVEKLKNYSHSEVKSIVPDLLIWTQDMNWPVAHPVAKYLKTIVDDISDDILKILYGNDGIWKYWTIINFGPVTKDERIIEEIKRIATRPTELEIRDEVDEVAREVLEKRGNKA